MILYEMLLGRRPTGFVIKWPTETDVFGASPALDGLLQRTLCEARDRFQTAAEALCALDALAPPSTPGGGATEPSRRIVWHRLLHSLPLTDRTVEVLLSLPCLEEVEIPRTQITDEGLIRLADHPCLRGVHVEGCRVTPGVVELLRKRGLRLQVYFK